MRSRLAPVNQKGILGSVGPNAEQEDSQNHQEPKGNSKVKEIRFFQKIGFLNGTDIFAFVY